jgi:Na+-translocating ferredoxin:NAD+ oxidoreductase RnfE subunit
VIREFLGTGTITVWKSLVIDFTGFYRALNLAPTQFFLSPVGAFLVLGILAGSINAYVLDRRAKQAKKVAVSK